MRLDAAAKRIELANALPMPYPQLASAGLLLRPGQTSLWVAGTGVGKSQLLNNITQRSGIPTVFWSADTDTHDVLIRSCAMWSGSTTAEVEVNWRDDKWRAYYREKIRAGRNVEWIFDAAIVDDVLKERLDAYVEVHGVYPQMLVLDNLSNTVRHAGESLAEQQEVMVAVQRLARLRDMHVAVLTHATGEYDKGDKPIPLDGVLNKVTKTLELVVTMFKANDEGTRLGVVMAKTRGAKPDPSARRPVYLDIDFSRATVCGFAA